MKNVLKFGGTSVGTAENMKKVAVIVDDPSVRLVVLSAMSGTTDLLVKIETDSMYGRMDEVKHNVDYLQSKYKTCIEDLLVNKDESLRFIEETFNKIEGSKCTYEGQFQPYGELMTTFIFSCYLKEQGKKTVLLHSPDFMHIDAEGAVNSEVLGKMKEATSDAGTIYIAQGFIALKDDGHLGTLGRGGSDYSAALMGAAIGADEVQIWTDIDGMHTGDPRFVKGTKPIRMMSFDEAAEMAYFGAKILHPATIEPCKKNGIPVRLKNTMDPAASGTIISSESETGSTFHAVAAKDGIALIRITSNRMLMAYGFLRRIFEIFEKWKTPIDMVTTSEVAVSLTIDNIQHLNEIRNELEKLATVEIEQNNSIISIVGCMEYGHSGIACRIFKAVENIPIKMVSYGASHRSFSIIIDTKYKVATLQSLNNNLF